MSVKVWYALILSSDTKTSDRKLCSSPSWSFKLIMISLLFLPFCSQTKQVWSFLYFWPSTWLKITHFYHAKNYYHNVFRSGFVFSSSLHSQWKKLKGKHLHFMIVVLGVNFSLVDCCVKTSFLNWYYSHWQSSFSKQLYF